MSARWTLALWLLVARQVSAASPPSEAREAAREELLVGVVASSQSLDLAPLIDGRLEQVKVNLGERVQVGQVVASLESRMYQLELSMRQANLKAADAEHARALLLLEQAKKKLQREQKIRDLTAAEDVEKAENEVQLATVNVDMAKAKLAEAQAQAAIATENVEQTRIRAPFTGTVSELYLQPGTLVNRATPVLRLVREELRLRFAIPEALATTIRQGTEVRVWVKGLGTPVQGVVDRLSPELDPTSRHLRAEARLVISEAMRGRLPIGMVVDVGVVSKASPSGK
ncbi:efflux RND transporter periplasmic adaptor subunit [Archangium gephyra]|uniref:efflux RND transporter periplasmic adaptor subunit n=1 Tax=Archangium gephyra TaxID=48 RepID=UPI0035D4F027